MPMTVENMTQQASQASGSPCDRLARLPGQAVAVVGAGRSGLAATRLLVALGARVSLVDHRPETEWAATVPTSHPWDIGLFGGERFAHGLEAVDLVVVSPGVPSDLEALDGVRQRGVPVVGEVEVASWLFSIPVIGVTGTNGKSTVVSLLGGLFRECGRTPFVGGNLGPPLAEAALTIHQHARAGRTTAPPVQAIVAELSSFQLETIDRFRPHIAVLLNITPDHLDRYPDFAAYARAKTRIFRNQTSEDFALLNADDPHLRTVRPSLRGRLVEWSLTREVPAGVWVDGDTIMTRWNGPPEALMPVNEIALAGRHNLSNVLAAVAVGMVSGCSRAGMRRAVQAFRGLAHACEVVCERRGVTFIDDSKGTNVDATIHALNSLGRPVVIILGGRAKGLSEFHRLQEPLRRNAVHCIVLGESAATIARAVAGAGAVSRVSSLAEGVKLAATIAAPGDAVLLSPACASFDMFRDYRDRGQQFQELVKALPHA